VNLVNQALGVAWREKSFGQRLNFGPSGGKFVPLGPRTIFLGRPKRRMHLPISRMSLIFVLIDNEIKTESIRRLQDWPVIIGKMSFTIYSPRYKIQVTG